MTKRIVAILTVLVLALSMTACAAAADVTEPAMDIIDYLSSLSSLDLNPYRGKVIALNFFTSWCGYCMEEMPRFKQVFTEYNPEEIEIILVHAWNGEGQKEGERVKERFGLEEMNIYEDTDCSLTNSLGIIGFPTTLFIAQDGVSVSGANGMITYDQLTQHLDTLGVSRVPAAEVTE